MSAEKKLSQVMMELVNEKTFSLEGVKAIEIVRIKAEKLELALEDSRHENDMLRKDINKFRSNELRISGYETALNVREGNIKDREVKMSDAEKRVAVAEAVANVYADVVGRVFANRQVRETTMNRAFPVDGGDYNGQKNMGTVVTSHTPETTTRTEE